MYGGYAREPTTVWAARWFKYSGDPKMIDRIKELLSVDDSSGNP